MYSHTSATDAYDLVRKTEGGQTWWVWAGNFLQSSSTDTWQRAGIRWPEEETPRVLAFLSNRLAGPRDSSRTRLVSTSNDDDGLSALFINLTPGHAVFCVEGKGGWTTSFDYRPILPATVWEELVRSFPAITSNLSAITRPPEQARALGTLLFGQRR